LNFSVSLVFTLATYPTIDWTEDERSWCALVAQIAKGNQDALTELYDSTNRMVYGLALRILGNSSSAEEVLFDVYVQVWRTAKSFDPSRGKVTSWLVSMARSRAIDALRSRQGRRANLARSLDDISDLQDLRGGPEEHSVLRSRAQVVQKSLAELPEDQRNAIELAYFSGLTHGEIAARTGLPLGTVKTRIRSGMLRLRELLAPYQENL
jgi:RNA polymerase sigma-70 factor (ECF subfamily)